MRRFYSEKYIQSIEMLVKYANKSGEENFFTGNEFALAETIQNIIDYYADGLKVDRLNLTFEDNIHGLASYLNDTISVRTGFLTEHDTNSLYDYNVLLFTLSHELYHAWQQKYATRDNEIDEQARFEFEHYTNKDDLYNLQCIERSANEFAANEMQEIEKILIESGFSKSHPDEFKTFQEKTSDIIKGFEDLIKDKLTKLWDNGYIDDVRLNKNGEPAYNILLEKRKQDKGRGVLPFEFKREVYQLIRVHNNINSHKPIIGSVDPMSSDKHRAYRLYPSEARVLYGYRGEYGAEYMLVNHATNLCTKITFDTQQCFIDTTEPIKNDNGVAPKISKETVYNELSYIQDNLAMLLSKDYGLDVRNMNVEINPYNFNLHVNDVNEIMWSLGIQRIEYEDKNTGFIMNLNKRMFDINHIGKALNRRESVGEDNFYEHMTAHGHYRAVALNNPEFYDETGYLAEEDKIPLSDMMNSESNEHLYHSNHDGYEEQERIS